MNNIAVFGGTSGLAKQVIPHLNGKVTALSSTDCDVRSYANVSSVIKEHNVAVYFSVVNYDNLISSIDETQLQHSLDVNIKGYLNVLKAAGL
jgi:dTDP-4-dehydrorhamnose reductase